MKTKTTNKVELPFGGFDYQSELDKLFTDIFNPVNTKSQHTPVLKSSIVPKGWLTDTYVKLSDDGDNQKSGWSLKLMVPGIPKEDISISFVNDELVISFEVKNGESKDYYNKSIKLPQLVNPDSIDASLELGILHIKVANVKQVNTGSKINIR